MKAKLVLTALVIYLFAGQLNAQIKPVLGIHAGINFQNITGKNSAGQNLDNKIKAGVYAGIIAEAEVGTDLYIQPGILYSTKGSKDKYINAAINLSYLEIPINFLYKPHFGVGHLLMGFGPYVAYALSGSNRIGDLKKDIEFGSNPGTLKRVDAGANFLAGYEWSNHFSIQVHAGLGLVNIKNRMKPDHNSSLKNTGFGIAVGYKFKK